jgi:SAM-dependent methyltransferase
MAETSSITPCGQQRIWGHFQNNEPQAFEAARPRLDFLVAQVRKHCRIPKPVVLNVGVGNGYFERQAVGQSWEVHSLDPDENALTPLTSLGVKTHVGLVEAIPLEKQSCDCVVVSEVLEHLSESQGKSALSEIARILKPGGIFFGTVPYCENLQASQVICPCCGALFHRWGHQRSFTPESLSKELAAFFSVKKIRRTAFVSYRGSSPLGILKSLIRLVLAKSGQMIAVPSLYWFVVK